MRSFWLLILVFAGVSHVVGGVLACRERYGKLRLLRLAIWPGGTTMIWYGQQLREKGIAALRESSGVLLLTISYLLLLAVVVVVAVAVFATLAARLLS